MHELTAEMIETVKQYRALQLEEQQLKERKQELQKTLKAHLRSGGKSIWTPEVDGVRLKVSYRSVPQVDYDEGKLRARLGDRYHALLEPDLKKLRAELPTLGNELAPLLDRIGSPSPDKVKAAVEAGTVCADEFKGAFVKTIREYITVSILKENTD